jgi:hypothetical protein
MKALWAVCCGGISFPSLMRDGMAQHAHEFTIGDDAAVHALLNKLTKESGKQAGRAKLLRALDDASRHYEDSKQKSAARHFFMGCRTVTRWH